MYWVVDNVQVQSSGTDAADTREQAFISGQRKAFDKLLNLLPVQPSVRQHLAHTSDAEILELIFDFSVQDEQLAPGQYRAILRYRFSKETVAKWLQTKHVVLYAPADTENGPDSTLRGSEENTPPSNKPAQELPLSQDSAFKEYVEVPVTRLADWFAIEKKLIQYQDMYRIHSYSSRWIVLQVSPQFLQTRNTLQQQGMKLEYVDSIWRLSCTAAH
ncbi:MAG: hypothetical protein LBQ26_02070 [Holosporales bacterium]|nr:hypothetical protein [Holosporales bacterium]